VTLVKVTAARSPLPALSNRLAIHPSSFDEAGHRVLRRVVHKQMNVLGLAIHLQQFCLEISANLGEDGSESFDRVSVKYLPSLLGDEDQMNMKLRHTVSTVP